jgi:hypothetical protein
VEVTQATPEGKFETLFLSGVLRGVWTPDPEPLVDVVGVTVVGTPVPEPFGEVAGVGTPVPEPFGGIIGVGTPVPEPFVEGAVILGNVIVVLLNPGTAPWKNRIIPHIENITKRAIIPHTINFLPSSNSFSSPFLLAKIKLAIPQKNATTAIVIKRYPIEETTFLVKLFTKLPNAVKS